MKRIPDKNHRPRKPIRSPRKLRDSNATVKEKITCRRGNDSCDRRNLLPCPCHSRDSSSFSSRTYKKGKKEEYRTTRPFELGAADHDTYLSSDGLLPWKRGAGPVPLPPLPPAASELFDDFSLFSAAKPPMGSAGVGQKEAHRLILMGCGRVCG